MRKRCTGRYAQRSSANVFHRATSTKVDLFVLGGSPLDRQALNRRVRLRVATDPDRFLYVYTPEDILINDNYFCRSPRQRSAGRGSTRGACDTARFPRGGRVGHGWAGSAIAREADGREDAGGGRRGGGDTWLSGRHPGRFQAGQLRTLQRRVRDWRAQHGPDREVYFEQVAVPGREAAFDFTDASGLGVTIRGGAGPLRAALVADPAGEAARERGRRAGPLPDEDGHRAGVAVAGRHRLRRRDGVSGLCAGGR